MHVVIKDRYITAEIQRSIKITFDQNHDRSKSRSIKSQHHLADLLHRGSSPAPLDPASSPRLPERTFWLRCALPQRRRVSPRRRSTPPPDPLADPGALPWQPSQPWLREKENRAEATGNIKHITFRGFPQTYRPSIYYTSHTSSI